MVSIVVGLVAVTIFTPFTFVKGLSSPANVGLFVYVMTVFPLILAAVSYSALGLLEMRKPARTNSLRFSILRRTIAVLVLAFVIGGFTVGALAAATENQLLSSAASSADVIPEEPEHQVVLVMLLPISPQPLKRLSHG